MHCCCSSYYNESVLIGKIKLPRLLEMIVRLKHNLNTNCQNVSVCQQFKIEIYIVKFDNRKTVLHLSVRMAFVHSNQSVVKFKIIMV